MSLEKIVGLETEYGIVLKGRRDESAEEVSRRLVEACMKKVYGFTDSSSPLWGHRFDWMLPNGARFYVDHGHPEYSTPECRTVTDLIACDKAGERILRESAKIVNEQLPEGQSVSLFRNNTDYKGHSYGCHENYFIAEETFEALIHPKSEKLHRHLIPFLVTRQIYTGAGKVGSENGRPKVDYQISQRADFFEKIIGLQTTHQRPLINTRNEPHADGKRFRRLHVILGDANMCEVATFLKVGTLQIILRMLEDGADLPDMTLADSVCTFYSISHDAPLEGTIERENGQSISPTDLQREYWCAAVEYLKDQPESECERQVLSDWDFVLQKLPSQREQLVGRIDWITKRYLIERFMQKTGEAWESPFMKELDIKYHNIDPQESHFYLLAEVGSIEKRIDDSAVDGFVEHPPSDTRAYLRGEYLRRFGEAVTEVDWSLARTASDALSLEDPRVFANET